MKFTNDKIRASVIIGKFEKESEVRRGIPLNTSISKRRTIGFI
jgi:hypothetical protein